MSGTDIALLSAGEQLALLQSGAISAEGLLHLMLGRVDRLNPRFNAVIAFDLERARSEARAVDAARARGEALPPLAGLPITIKECYEAAGMPACCGFPFLADHRPAEDADAVAALRRAGAIIYGKTNLPQGASDWQSFNPVYGLTRNPWDEGRSPGGSSGGSAVSVALGLTAFELGSDIGGSIRIPAHFCGVYGHKPSYGLVPMRGHIPPMPGALYQPELGVGGPLARSAGDLALVLPLLAGRDLAPPRGEELADFRVGLWLGEGSDFVLDDGVRAALEAHAEALAKAGARIERVAMPVDAASSHETYMRTLFAIVGAAAPGEADEFAKCIPDDPTGIAEQMSRYMRCTLPEWFELQDRRAHLYRGWARYFATYDVLLTAPVPVVAFPHMAQGQGVHSEQLARRITVNGKPVPYLDFTWQGLATVANLPATVMPTGRMHDGLPVGMQVIGPWMEDLTAIRFAELAAQAVGGFVPPPVAQG
ncbi:amidase family protein [Alteraurantiacibacter palmitatis]|uniref:Amidase family protein n=1 Tax=Alteraurantiacibacter palmitatis TaxID=2054628 RepID=A0ABV7E8F3_9SPHN